MRGKFGELSAGIGHAFRFGLLVDPFQQLFRLPFSAGTGGISVGLPIGWVENSIWMEWKCIFYDITNGESHWYASPFGPTHNPHSLAKTLPIYIIGKKGKSFVQKLSYLKFKILNFPRHPTLPTVAPSRARSSVRPTQTPLLSDSCYHTDPCSTDYEILWILNSLFSWVMQIILND